MPYLLPSDYEPPRFLSNPHLQTIYASFARNIKANGYRRERVNTPDGDFVDLDWSEVGRGPIAILVHGLEGSSQSAYMRGMTQALNRRGINVVCINLRGCSSEINRMLIGYDLGSTQDIEYVSKHVSILFPERVQYLVGFSLGGNLVLKYLGERGKYVRPQIKGAVTFSVPCDLKSAASIIHSSSNRLYFYRFMLSIQLKLRQKARQFPGRIPVGAMKWPRSFAEFDDSFTVPFLGFESVEVYWEKSSCKYYLSKISVPALLVNSKDDPLIGEESYPASLAADSQFFHLETPEHGGHVGFVSFGADGEYWSEKRVALFLNF